MSYLVAEITFLLFPCASVECVPRSAALDGIENNADCVTLLLKWKM